MTTRRSDDDLAQRRKALRLRSERLRREAVQDAELVGEVVTRAEDTVESARRFASPAVLLAGGALLLILLANPARSIAWFTRAALLLSMARRGLSVYKQFRAELAPPRQ